MIQGFNSQLITNDVGTDITASGRAELPDLCLSRESLSQIALDQNFTNQGGINYVNMSVPSDMPMNRNFYSTVSLPQTIVSSIDQPQEPMSSVYVHSGDHILDKSIPLSQTYSSSVNVGGLLPIGPVVMHQGDTGMVIPDNPPITAERMDKPPALKNLKLTFSTRSFESLTYLDIPTFLSEYAELRKAYFQFSKDEAYSDVNPPDEIVNPQISQIPVLLNDYKTIIQNLKKCFVCPTCNKGFTSRYSLNTHMATHSEIRAYECPHADCGKCFRSRSALNTHINLVHAEVKQNVCSVCGKSFAKVWLLRQHMTRHKSNHRYTCSKCSQSFAYPYLLKEHEMTKHDGIKPYVCSFEGCGKQFNSKNTLHLHELAHSKPFVCPVCYRQFGYACDLKRHQRKAHSISSVC